MMQVTTLISLVSFGQASLGSLAASRRLEVA